MTTQNQRIKSNTVILFPPIVIMFAFLILLERYTNISDKLFRLLFFVMFGYLFIGTAIAQNRSGYFWKNLSKGNRGKHRSESPKQFILSNLFYLILGLSIWSFGIIRFIK